MMNLIILGTILWLSSVEVTTLSQKLGLLTVTHARSDSDYSVVQKYMHNYAEKECYKDLLQEINIIWNNQQAPQEVESMQQGKQWQIPVNFYVTNNNSMNHRYRIPKESVADFFYSLDDDIISDCEVINKTMNIYKEVNQMVPGVVVTHQVRAFEFNPKKAEEFSYQGSPTAKYFSIVQPGASFYSKEYLGLYYLKLREIEQLHESVNILMNCDDIYFASLIAHFFPEISHIYYKPASRNYRNSDPKVGNSRTKGIINIREYCITNVTKILGYYPLRLYNKDHRKYKDNWQYPNLQVIMKIKMEALSALDEITRQEKDQHVSQQSHLEEATKKPQIDMKDRQKKSQQKQQPQKTQPPKEQKQKQRATKAQEKPNKQEIKNYKQQKNGLLNGRGKDKQIQQSLNVTLLKDIQQTRAQSLLKKEEKKSNQHTDMVMLLLIMLVVLMLVIAVILVGSKYLRMRREHSQKQESQQYAINNEESQQNYIFQKQMIKPDEQLSPMES